jgi:hypothetical protein
LFVTLKWLFGLKILTSTVVQKCFLTHGSTPFFFNGDIDALFGANIGNWSEDFAIRFWSTYLVYLENLKPWLQKSKSKLVICHVISFFYTHWNGSWKDRYWKAMRRLVLFILLNRQTLLVFHIIHKKSSTFQSVTSLNNYMSYGVLKLLKILEVQKV